MNHKDLSELGTEARNPRSEQLDAMSTLAVEVPEPELEPPEEEELPSS